MRNLLKISIQFLLLLIFICPSPLHCQLAVTTPDPTGQNCTFSGPGHCPTGFVCLNGLCARRCYFMGSCPGGFICQSNFACVRKICPISDTNCCSHCPERCNKPEECPRGWGCVFKKCRRVECQSRNDCEFSWPCVMGKCQAKTCSNDSDCPEDFGCGPVRRCTKKSTQN